MRPSAVRCRRCSGAFSGWPPVAPENLLMKTTRTVRVSADTGSSMPSAALGVSRHCTSSRSDTSRGKLTHRQVGRVTVVPSLRRRTLVGGATSLQQVSDAPNDPSVNSIRPSFSTERGMAHGRRQSVPVLRPEQTRDSLRTSPRFHPVFTGNQSSHSILPQCRMAGTGGQSNTKGCWNASEISDQQSLPVGVEDDASARLT